MIIKTVITSATSPAELFFLTKLIGSRQMSQLNLFDYINGITIGSIAAEMATSPETDPLQPLTAMITYAVIVVGISVLTRKFVYLREFFSGNPLILFEDGQLIEENFKKPKIDLNGFLMGCRNSGCFDISNLQSIILEAKGRPSFLPTAQQRPLTLADMNINPPQERLVINVIIDGKIMYDNLKNSGNNEQWLLGELARLTGSTTKVGDVFLATCDAGNRLCFYLKNKQPKRNPSFI